MPNVILGLLDFFGLFSAFITGRMNSFFLTYSDLTSVVLPWNYSKSLNNDKPEDVDEALTKAIDSLDFV